MTAPYVYLNDVSLSYLTESAQTKSLKKELLNKLVGGRITKATNGNFAVTALSSINLKLESGCKLAVLGHNGSGKTSLLRCMAGIFPPSSGEVVRQGSCEVLIDPYAGLNHDASGRENIYNLGYARGHSKSTINPLEKKIIEFSELTDFIDMPVRSFSLGMVSRLSFSLIIHLDAQILLIDEGVGAGDESFQKKASEKFQKLVNQTEILVLATHSIDVAKMYCEKFIKLETKKQY